MKKIIYISIFLLLLIHASYATKYETAQNGDWNTTSTWVSPEGKPVLGWGTTNDTIIVKHIINLDVNLTYEGTIIIESGASLTNTSSNLKLLSSDGELINNGTLSVNKINNNSGTITNSGSITTVGNFINENGDVTNSGTIVVGDDLKNNWNGASIVNTGSISVADKLINNWDADGIDNSGSISASTSISNYAPLTNSGTITTTTFTNDYDMSNTGILTVTGNFTNEESITNSGDLTVGNDFTNKWDSELINNGDIEIGNNFTAKGDIISTDTISIGNNLSIDWGIDVTNTGFFEVSEDVSNNGSINTSGEFEIGDDLTTNWNTSIVNDGNFTIGGDAATRGTFTNNDTLIVVGDFENKADHTLNNNGDIEIGGNLDNDGAFNNDGTATVDGDLDNDGTIDTGNGSQLLVDGTMDNDGGSVEGDGYVCDPDNTTDPTGGDPTNIDGGVNICGNEGGGALPVELLDFNIKVIADKQVVFTWQTVSETNNDYFEVQRSTDARNFETIAIIKGAGNSNQINYYQSSDNNPFSGTVYYRLKQTDFDGKYSYPAFETVLIERSTDIVVYPNPVKQGNIVNITLENNISQVYVYDVFGKLISKTENASGVFQIRTNNLDQGYYFVKVNGPSGMTTKKFQVF